MSEQANSPPKPPVYAPPIPVRALRQGVNVPVRQGLGLLGVALLVLAVPAAVLTPGVPVGLPMIVVGLVLVTVNAFWVRTWAEGVLTRHPRLEQRLPESAVRLALGRAKRVAKD
jgi:Flp pilus assembly protein TadB